MTLYQNPNAFTQSPVRGQEDLGISRTGVLSGVVSVNQGTALTPGDWVTLDTTSGYLPSVVQVGTSTVAKLGVVMFTSKQSSFSAGNRIEIALVIGAPVVVYLQSAAAIAVLAEVEDAGTETVQTKSSGKMIGLALDPATAANQLIRVMLTRVEL